MRSTLYFVSVHLFSLSAWKIRKGWFLLAFNATWNRFCTNMLQDIARPLKIRPWRSFNIDFKVTRERVCLQLPRKIWVKGYWKLYIRFISVGHVRTEVILTFVPLFYELPTTLVKSGKRISLFTRFRSKCENNRGDDDKVMTRLDYFCLNQRAEISQLVVLEYYVRTHVRLSTLVPYEGLSFSFLRKKISRKATNANKPSIDRLCLRNFAEWSIRRRQKMFAYRNKTDGRSLDKRFYCQKKLST